MHIDTPQTKSFRSCDYGTFIRVSAAPMQSDKITYNVHTQSHRDTKHSQDEQVAKSSGKKSPSTTSTFTASNYHFISFAVGGLRRLIMYTPTHCLRNWTVRK